MTQHGLGRRHAPDPRDLSYPLSALLPRRSTRSYRYWPANSIVLDQGQTPECVAYSLTHWLVDSPTTHTMRALDVKVSPPGLEPRMDAFMQKLYDEAQQIDEFADTPPAGGTSVRAGAKVLQGWGFINSYHWASGIDDVVQHILEVGPVVYGTDFYESMENPRQQRDGTYFCDVSGSVLGGHAYKLDGVNLTKGLVRWKNSWGRSFGRDGHCYMAIEDAERLLRANGEAFAGVEA